MAKAIKFANDIYLDDTSSISNRTRLDVKLRHDLMYIGFVNNSSWTQKDVWVPVGFGRVMSSVGDRLIFNMPYIKIGANVKRVRVYGLLTYYQCPDDNYMFLGITVNDEVRVKTVTTTGLWGNISIEATINVNQNDKIGLSVYKSSEATYTLHDFQSFTEAPGNYLLVEVIE